MDENPLKSQLRRECRETRLGPSPCCAKCGLENPAVLRRMKRTLLEKHHVAGRAHDPSLTILLCANCHLEVTENARDAGADMRKQPTVLDRLAMVLRAIGSFFIAIGDAFCRYADDILKLVSGLDEHFKDWRCLVEAR